MGVGIRGTPTPAIKVGRVGAPSKDAESTASMCLTKRPSFAEFVASGCLATG